MKIIGHRGAAGLALENTLESIRVAKEIGVDAIEIDVRLTSDKHFVLCHDHTVGRVSKHNHIIKNHKISQLEQLDLHNGENLPSLSDALREAGETPFVIEVKGSGWGRFLAEYLVNHEIKDSTIISFSHNDLAFLKRKCPSVQTFSIERTKAFEAIQLAKQNHFTGVDFNYWLLNPLTYWLAKRKNLKIIVYTVNSPRIAWLLSKFFPDIGITTDFPDKLQFLRKDRD